MVPETEEELLLQAASAIADALGEVNRRPRKSIRRIVRAKGADFARRHLEEALDIYALGGMQRWDRKGERSLGGVFFALVRQTLGTREFLWLAFRPAYRQKRLKAVTDARLAAEVQQSIPAPDTQRPARQALGLER